MSQSHITYKSMQKRETRENSYLSWSKGIIVLHTGHVKRFPGLSPSYGQSAMRNVAVTSRLPRDTSSCYEHLQHKKTTCRTEGKQFGLFLYVSSYDQLLSMFNANQESKCRSQLSMTTGCAD
jgi:hypothetical protein